MQMRLEIGRVEGRRNDLLLRLDRREIETARLSVAHRQRLMALPGIPRHRRASPEEETGLAACKLSIDEHLHALDIVDDAGIAQRRAVGISNRNLGANHGHVAWQAAERPHIFRVLEDPCDYPSYSCLTVWKAGGCTIEDLRFDAGADRIHDAVSSRDVSGDVEWASFGQRILRGGSVTRIDDIADQFYDIRHVLAFDRGAEGDGIRREIYEDYPRKFREHVLRAWRDRGVPRSRYVHNAIGMSAGELIVIQKEGTIEEIAASLQQAGAADGLILDNGGSVACWTWWVNDYRGGLVSPTVDYRPPGTSAIAFVLKGPARVKLPGGSVSYSVE